MTIDRSERQERFLLLAICKSRIKYTQISEKEVLVRVKISTYQVIVEYRLPPPTRIEEGEDLLARVAEVVAVEPDVYKGVPVNVLNDVL